MESDLCFLDGQRKTDVADADDRDLRPAFDDLLREDGAAIVAGVLTSSGYDGSGPPLRSIGRLPLR
jgi:hypothetical protein